MSESTTGSSEQATPATRPRRVTFRRAVLLAGAVLLLYLAVAYIIVPGLWRRYERRHPAFDNVPGITLTGDDHPGDPLNVALVGMEIEVKKIMIAAKWYPADPLTLRSCLEIAEASVLKRPYGHAPVSNLFLWGRKEDLAFEQPVGDNPRERHHVRFWCSDLVDPDGRPVWFGAAIFDKKVGLSHTTGQITHHTAADIDTERDYLFSNLKQTGDLSEDYVVEAFHKVLQGKNGGGDPWHTDGKLRAGVIGRTILK
jgi:hypothetical protein